ncbi:MULTISPECIES: hypothetical protein [Arthrobacter]|nr:MULTISPECIES: hypothetical protein [Arthrobacter]MBT8162944.1 hypothetical protein [Arthrobacter sp. GN70]
MSASQERSSSTRPFDSGTRRAGATLAPAQLRISKAMETVGSVDVKVL